MDPIEVFSLKSSTKFSAAVQITRPKSAPAPGSSLTNSPINQFKVAKLVLKPAENSISNKIFSLNKPSSPQKREASPQTRPHSALESTRSTQNRNKFASNAPPLKYQQTAELEKKIRKVEKERKALIQQPVAAAKASPNHKSSAMDEAARSEAREYMKKQREKRKLEMNKEVDKSFVIKQRLDELRKTTRNVITKKPKKNKSQIKVSPPREYYSMTNVHMKEIKVLKLKPTSAKSQKSPAENSFRVLNESSLKFASPDSEKVLETTKTPSLSPIKKCISPIKKPTTPVKKPANPLQLQNRQNTTRAETTQRQSRPSSSKENKKPLDDLKLKVPDVKLSMSNLNRTEVVYQTFTQPKPKVPFWLEDTAIQPYPYNFIWAVRKKLEAYTSSEKSKRIAKEKSLINFETPHVKQSNRHKKVKKFPQFIASQQAEMQRPTIADDSGTNENTLEHELEMEANTISEISSIQSDMALIKSHSQEKEPKRDDEDDTTISESIFHSLKDDAFVGKQRESINTNFNRSSWDKENVALENVSPNTTEKREKFLSSTKLSLGFPVVKPETDINDLDNNKLNQEKEEEYQKMLTAFNQSLSHVIQVNQMLSTVLTSKTSSIASSHTSETVKNYTSSFENNIESETLKTGGSNISEMIEHLVQQSQNAPAPADTINESISSIQTFIEDSKSTTIKPDVDDAIEDPPIVYKEAPEFSSSTTKVTTTTTTEIVQHKITNEKKEEHENTLNESKLLNMFKYESETSFNFSLAENNASFGMLMNQSSTEIKTWERKLIDQTRGQIAWLELQKQNFRKHGQQEKVSAIKKQQRAILLRLDKERSKLKESSERSSTRVEDETVNSNTLVENVLDTTTNESDARENIERILQQREQKIDKRRAQVEHLVNWQRKLDKEEEKLRQMEKDLLGVNMKKLSSSPRKKKLDEDLLNTSIKMVKSIDKSLMILDNIEPSLGEESIDVPGEKLNKLWHRLTGVAEKKYLPTNIYHMGKQDFAQFYENAKEFVLQSDLKLLLDISVLPQQQIENRDLKNQQLASEQDDEDKSDVSTMNSIANIETEEEYPGSLVTTENDEDLHQILANQMKVFLDQKKPTAEDEVLMKNNSSQIPIDNTTFQVRPKSSDLDQSLSSIGESEMDIEQDSLIQTEPLLSIDNSSVDADGFIIPEENSIQITDMDQDDEPQDGQLIEDISFPNLDMSSDEMLQLETDENNHNDLSTITECTEYEQSQGSTTDEISSDLVSRSSTATPSERANSEIEKRLISINDSLEEINEAFKNVAIINRSPSTVTYSTDKDFVDSPKASTSSSNEKSEPNDLLMFSPYHSDSTIKESLSQITTSTPKILMPDILSEVSDSKKEEKSDDF